MGAVQAVRIQAVLLDQVVVVLYIPNAQVVTAQVVVQVVMEGDINLIRILDMMTLALVVGEKAVAQFVMEEVNCKILKLHHEI